MSASGRSSAMVMWRSCVLSLCQSVKDHSDSLSAADAHGFEAVAGVTARHFVK
jgi:hypothetical protein